MDREGECNFFFALRVGEFLPDFWDGIFASRAKGVSMNYSN